MGDGDVFYQLIEALLQRVGHHQIERVFAVVGHRSADVVEVLRQLGFQPYTQQSIWMLAELGVRDSDIPTLARNAMADACLSTNPRHTTEADLADLFRAAL